MTISAPPTAPNPADPSTFNARAVAWVNWWTAAITEINALSGMTNSGQFLDGLVGTPGITWVNDPDTGLYRPAANQIGFATGGAQRALLSNTAFTVNVPIGGTAVQSSVTDTTAGRLLTLGAFGLGQAGAVPTISNIDATTTANGFWRYTTGATGTFPTGVTAAAGGTIVMVGENTSKGYMLLQPTGSTDLYFRNLNTTWGAWQHLMSLDASLSSSAGQLLRMNDTNTALVYSNGLLLQTPQALSGQTLADFSIPSWANRISVLLAGASLNNADTIFVQAGTSGGVVTTGYNSSSATIDGGATAGVNTTNGMVIYCGAAGDSVNGKMELVRLSPGGNEWVQSHVVSRGTQVSHGGGRIALGAALDRIRVTRSATGTFDAGNVNVMCE